MDAHPPNTGIIGRLSIAIEEIWTAKGRFFFAFFFVFLISYAILFIIDFIPEAPEEKTPAGGVVPVENARPITSVPSAREPEIIEAEPVAPYPDRITIPELDIDVAVLNPESTDIATLDAALLKGVVRHPDSADFNETGTVFLFGHSSYLPVVHNKNFQAFNGIQNLTWGDEITMVSDDMVYTYRVEKVSKVAASETEMTLKRDKNRLVLVTCNSFGSKDDRFVVEAELVEKTPVLALE